MILFEITEVLSERRYFPLVLSCMLKLIGLLDHFLQKRYDELWTLKGDFL